MYFKKSSLLIKSICEMNFKEFQKLFDQSCQDWEHARNFRLIGIYNYYNYKRIFPRIHSACMALHAKNGNGG